MHRTNGRAHPHVEQCAAWFFYRRSVYQLHPEWVLLNATLELSPSDTVTVRAAMERMASRRKNQPLEYPSAGSVFRRPAQPDVYVGRLVEDCGLKGFRIGGAEVSEKHAGFIVNRGDATADDVRRLIAHVQEAVLRAYGIELKCEVCIVRRADARNGRSSTWMPVCPLPGMCGGNYGISR